MFIYTKKTQNPINALKISIYNTNRTNNAKIHFKHLKKWTIPNQIIMIINTKIKKAETFSNINFLILNFHNSYFIYFVYFVIRRFNSIQYDDSVQYDDSIQFDKMFQPNCIICKRPTRRLPYLLGGKRLPLPELNQIVELNWSIDLNE